MAESAMTAGVKPGGLTTTNEIRILLCWLAARAKAPITRRELSCALIGEELVNYFELAVALAYLCDMKLLKEEDGRITALPAGAEVAETLESALPRSVRDTSERALQAAQHRTRLEEQHPVRIERDASGTGCRVTGALRDMDSDIFSFSLYVPDEAAARTVCERFIEDGDSIN